MKPKKAQTSIEFAILVAFAMMLLVVLLSVFQENVATIQKDQEWTRAQQVYDIIFTEIYLAQSTYTNYTRTFEIPGNIQGSDITIDCINDRDIIINYNEKKFVFFLNRTIPGCEDNLNIGIVTIKKIPWSNDPSGNLIDECIVFGENTLCG
ncbi:hypothetical protein K9L67_00660 [Candidatus Woesearchaeota archaeon]|nr:hypothetical protein [Candidatus Woesearchaeota archaeon]MCF7900718.1 hypothetical protein [Candidatus Woesearchaeota archaeon]MCF8013239.1 hypothetical protein [Candidatus Woesearchaeota archaeon]